MRKSVGVGIAVVYSGPADFRQSGNGILRNTPIFGHQRDNRDSKLERNRTHDGQDFL